MAEVIRSITRLHILVQEHVVDEVVDIDELPKPCVFLRAVEQRRRVRDHVIPEHLGAGYGLDAETSVKRIVVCILTTEVFLAKSSVGTFRGIV